MKKDNKYFCDLCKKKLKNDDKCVTSDFIEGTYCDKNCLVRAINPICKNPPEYYKEQEEGMPSDFVSIMVSLITLKREIDSEFFEEPDKIKALDYLISQFDPIVKKYFHGENTSIESFATKNVW